jgi:hypothetical protein
MEGKARGAGGGAEAHPRASILDTIGLLE